MAKPITPDRYTDTDYQAPVPPASAQLGYSEAEYRRVAIRRLKHKRDFRSHLFVYIVLNVAFWSGWLIDGVVNTFEFPWPVFPTVIWGLFILRHANDVFWKDPLREELVQQEIDKLRATSHIHPLEAYDVGDDDDDWC